MYEYKGAFVSSADVSAGFPKPEVFETMTERGAWRIVWAERVPPGVWRFLLERLRSDAAEHIMKGG